MIRLIVMISSKVHKLKVAWCHQLTLNKKMSLL